MGNRSKSQDEKIILRCREIDKLYTTAKDLYLQEHQDPSHKGKSYQAICDKVSQAHFAETGHRISLSTSTLQRHVKGGKPKSKSNAEKSWLTEEESKLIVAYTIDQAECGFPLKLKELKQYAEALLRACLGNSFPVTGLGKHWVECFVHKHNDRLQKYLSWGLDKARARGVNPTTHEAWFSLLASTIKKYNIEQECTYGSDEVGFLLRPLGRCNVVGPVNQKIQYDCAPENRENATVLCTICGDGTSLPPLVIFKGKHYFASWGKNNTNNFM